MATGDAHETHPHGRAGAARDATLQAIVTVLNQPGVAEEFIGARPIDAVKILKDHGMESELRDYITAAYAANNGIPLPSGETDEYLLPIKAEAEIGAAIAIRNALIAITSVYHHDPVSLRKVAYDCLRTSTGSEERSSFAKLMYQTIISEIGQGNALAGAKIIIQAHEEYVEGRRETLQRLISDNSKKQNAWRRLHNPWAHKIDDVELFQSGRLEYQDLDNTAKNVMVSSARRAALFNPEQTGRGEGIS